MIHDVVALYRSHGWATIRVQPCDKKPIGDWKGRTDEPDAFAEGDNVGVRLGAPSGGLVDVDLDCPEAIFLAPTFLPSTAVFGRRGASHKVQPAGLPGVTWETASNWRHWIYVCEDAITHKPAHTHCELRTTGLQSVFPPSIHESGVPIEWVSWGTGPRVIARAELDAAFGRLCAATIIARAWARLSGQRHDAVLALAGALWHSGWTEEDAADLLLPAMELDGSREPHRAGAIADTWAGDKDGIYGWPTVQRLLGQEEAGALERALAWVPVDRPAVVADSGERPEVDLAADQRDVLTAIASGLVDSRAHGLYRQGDALVTIHGPATAHRVAVELSRALRFVRQGQKTRVPAHVPIELASKVAADPPAVPELLGRRATPLLRADGSVWETVGYDGVTRMWCDGWADPRAVAYGRAAAAAACGRLLMFVHADQWEGPGDQWAWLAHVLTVAARPAVAGPVPAWIYSAATSGSGKTALARVAGLVGGGRSGGDITSPTLRDDEELARRLDLHALAPAVVLDNMHGALRSETLEGAVTAGVLAVRRLYVGPARVPWRAVLSVTSNGATIGHDWVRRTLPVRLNSRVLPARRDIVEEARCRTDLTADAVGVVAGWLQSGAVWDGTPLLGFVEWSRVVAGAIRWACGADVVAATRDASADMVAAEDDSGELLDTIGQWLGGREGFSSKELYESPLMMDLRAEYSDVAALGRRLGRCADKTRVLVRRKSHGQTIWRIENR